MQYIKIHSQDNVAVALADIAAGSVVTIDKDFGGWKAAQDKFFNDGGVFDAIFKEINK